MRLWRHIAQFGSGCGIEIRGDDLRLVALKSRPAGVSVLGRAVISDFRSRPAAEWGAEYAAFLKSCGLSQVAATVELPRQDVLVRQIQLPPMAPKERAAAVAYQLDSLHPFEEGQVYSSFAVIEEAAKESLPVPVVVVLAEKQRVDSYGDLFEQAGIAVASFTVGAAAMRAAVALRWEEPPRPFVLVEIREGRLEFYGESLQRPFLSTEFQLARASLERALSLVASELRLEPDEVASLVWGGEFDDAETAFRPSGQWQPKPPQEMLPAPVSAPADFDLRRDLTAFAVAVDSACPRLGWRLNLLPESRRKTDSRLMWAPTAALTVFLVLLGIGYLLRSPIQDREYYQALETAISTLEPEVAAVDEVRLRAEELRRKADLLSAQKTRTLADLRIISELSMLIPVTVWLENLDLSDDGVRINGMAEAAAPLLGILSDAKTVAGPSFLSSLTRSDQGERFQIGAKRREAAAPPPQVAEAATSAAATLSTLSESEAKDSAEAAAPAAAEEAP